MLIWEEKPDGTLYADVSVVEGIPIGVDVDVEPHFDERAWEASCHLEQFGWMSEWGPTRARAMQWLSEGIGRLLPILEQIKKALDVWLEANQE